jgi:hypothetical protein
MPCLQGVEDEYACLRSIEGKHTTLSRMVEDEGSKLEGEIIERHLGAPAGVLSWRNRPLEAESFGTGRAEGTATTGSIEPVLSFIAAVCGSPEGRVPSARRNCPGRLAEGRWIGPCC